MKTQSVARGEFYSVALAFSDLVSLRADRWLLREPVSTRVALPCRSKGAFFREFDSHRANLAMDSVRKLPHHRRRNATRRQFAQVAAYDTMNRRNSIKTIARATELMPRRLDSMSSIRRVSNCLDQIANQRCHRGDSTRAAASHLANADKQSSRCMKRRRRSFLCVTARLASSAIPDAVVSRVLRRRTNHQPLASKQVPLAPALFPQETARRDFCGPRNFVTNCQRRDQSSPRRWCAASAWLRPVAEPQTRGPPCK